MEDNKVIVLNSGGFDSVVLMHHLKEDLEFDLVSIFFNYGQPNYTQERECAEAVAKELEAEFIEINIPRFNWSNADMLTNKSEEFDTTKDYIELRNLIFISYACSIAESRGIKDIYLAILEGGTFTDTKEEFYDSLNEFTSNIGISIHTPFIDYSKETLGYMCRRLDIRSSYFSCNHPTNEGEPCGVCADCEVLKYINEEILTDVSPIQAWFSNDCQPSKKFKDLFIAEPITEMRFLINNKCQFKCDHCFYGSDCLKKTELTMQEKFRVIDEAIENGITHIHFSGKEPLYNEDIFEYCKYIRENHPGVTYDVVTNGVNVVKYKEQLKNSGLERVCLSVDSIEDLTIRPTAKHIIATIKALNEINMPIEVFIDVHQNNKTKVRETINHLTSLGVECFFIRPVIPVGNAKKLDTIISASDMNDVFKQVVEADMDNHDKYFYATVCVNESWIKGLEEDSELYEAIEYVKATADCEYYDRIAIMGEFYCGTYESQITVTPEGYVLGCGLELASAHYEKISSGNVKYKPLSECILDGKLKTLERMDRIVCNKGCYDCSNGCYHSAYFIKK